MNDFGAMTGVYNDTNGYTRTFYYDGAALITLPDFGGEGMIPAGINNAGQIIGGGTTPDYKGHAFLFSDGQMTELPMPAGANDWQLIAINDRGQIAGRLHRIPGSYGILLDTNGEVTELGSLGGLFTFPAAINNRGEIVGMSYVVDFTPPHAFLYRDGQMMDLGTAGGKGSAATAINDAGEIVGYIDYPDSVRHAMVYRNGRMQDIGTLGGAQARALAINEAGVVVGTSNSTPLGGIQAFIYLDGLMLNLNSLIDPAAGVTLNEALAINRRGEILGYGYSTVTSGRGFLLEPVTGTSRLTNLSLRAAGGSGERTMIVGFVVPGGASRRVLLRAGGPALAALGVADVLADPRVSVLGKDGTTIATNEDWGTTADSPEVAEAMGQTGALAFADGSKDAALVTTLAAGAYTVHVGGGETGGVALAEIYDAGEAADGALANLSGRAYVGTGDAIAIAGFVIAGTVPKTLLIRAVGPTLTNYGVSETLADPQLTVYANGTAVAGNDNWSAANNAAWTAIAASRVGAFALPEASKDAALFVTLMPGAYTVHVSGVGGATGVALIEIYDVL